LFHDGKRFRLWLRGRLRLWRESTAQFVETHRLVCDGQGRLRLGWREQGDGCRLRDGRRFRGD
jgi:hypothetical protein